MGRKRVFQIPTYSLFGTLLVLSTNEEGGCFNKKNKDIQLSQKMEI